MPGTKNTDFDGQSWTWHFARTQMDSGRVLFVAQHDYVGEDAAGVSPTTAIASMLSKEWVQKRYPLLFDHVLGPVQKEGLSGMALIAPGGDVTARSGITTGGAAMTTGSGDGRWTDRVPCEDDHARRSAS